MFDVKVTMSLEDYEFLLKTINLLIEENSKLEAGVSYYKFLNELENKIKEFENRPVSFDKVFRKSN